MPKQYEVLTGISYPPRKRAEPGDVVDDLPSESISWLLEQGHIQELSLARSKKPSGGQASGPPEVLAADEG